MKFNYPDGATPLTPDELQGLIPAYVTTQSELNALEQKNIASAQIVLLRQKLPYEHILTESFLCNLHKHMFNEVWRWAGRYRHSEKNIGVEWVKIPVKLRYLLDDVRFQIVHSSYLEQEIIVRFHHRLVSIHPFANGNGRHARIAADFLLLSLSGQVLTWGGNKIEDYKNASKTRTEYIFALREADKGNYEALLNFATKQ